MRTSPAVFRLAQLAAYAGVADTPSIPRLKRDLWRSQRGRNRRRRLALNVRVTLRIFQIRQVTVGLAWPGLSLSFGIRILPLSRPAANQARRVRTNQKRNANR